MTRDEIRKRFGVYRNQPESGKDNAESTDKKIENDWTQEEILAAAKKIIKRLNIQGEINDNGKML